MSGYVILGPICASRAEPIDKGTLNLQRTAVQGPVGMTPCGPPLSLADRIAEAVRRAGRYLPAETAAGLSALLTFETLGVISATLAAWAVSHSFGVGEAIDVLLLATGFVFLGREALQVIGHLSAFAKLVVQPGAQGDIDSAAWHLAKAITIIGINVIVVLLTHSSIKAYRGRYRPSIKGDPTLPQGEGGRTGMGTSFIRLRARRQSRHWPVTTNKYTPSYPLS